MCSTKSLQSQNNIIKSPYPPIEYPNISISEHLASSLTAHDPNSIALIDPNNNGTLTFGEVHQKGQEFASALLQLGVSKQDVVLYFADNSQQYVIAMVGFIYLGVTQVLLKGASGPFELAHRITDADVSVLIVGEDKLGVLEKALKNTEYRKAIEKLHTIVVLDADRLDTSITENEFLSKKVQIHTFDQTISMGAGRSLDHIPYFRVDLDKDHYLIAYTSGTTGPPKGCVHSHRTYLAGLFNFRPLNAMKVLGQTILVWHPMGHVSGALIITDSLINGKTVVLFSDTQLEPMLRAVEQFGVNQLFISPGDATALATNDYQKRYNLSSLKVIKSGGTKLAANILTTLKDKYKVFIVDSYGATECCGSVQNQKLKAFYENLEPGNLGPVLPNVEMKIIDLKSGEALPALEQGEVCFRGAPVFVKYLNNEEATKSTIDTEGWYHTGDVGYYNEDECLFISDRIKEMIKYKVWSVIPAEIEHFLLGHSAVESVCVVGVKHVTDGQFPRAYVKMAEGKSVTEQELIDYVKENMGLQNRLRAGVKFVQNIPLTVIGKVDRQHFKALIKDELITEQVE